MTHGSFIGEVGMRLGLAASTIRYYERRGLIDEPRRSASGYRVYAPEDEGKIAFVRDARSLGLSLNDIKELLSLQAGGQPPCRRLKELLTEHMDDLEGRIRELATRRDRIRAHIRQLDAAGIVPGVICGFIKRQTAGGPDGALWPQTARWCD